MKKTRVIPLFISAIILASFLTACTGGAGAVSNWPGLTLDPSTETVYLAYGAHIYAVNTSNGTERWRYPEKPQRDLFFYAKPALGEDGSLIEGGYDHKLYSLNLSNRQPNWNFAVATDKYIASPLVTSGAIIAPNADNTLYALDKQGGQLWKARGEHAFWSTPVTDGKLIYAASMDHHMYAFKPEDGRQVWKSDDLGGALTGMPALSAEGVLYIGTLGSKIIALDAASGRTLWQTPAKGWIWASPLISGDLVICSDLEGIVYALDAASGEIKWQVQPNAGDKRQITSMPVVVKDTLYFASQSGILYAVQLASGNPIWNKTIGGKIYSNLELAGEKILIAPMEFEAALVAVDLNGNVSWSYTPAK